MQQTQHYMACLLGYALQSTEGAAWLCGRLGKEAFESDRRAEAVFQAILSLVKSGSVLNQSLVVSKVCEGALVSAFGSNPSKALSFVISCIEIFNTGPHPIEDYVIGLIDAERARKLSEILKTASVEILSGKETPEESVAKLHAKIATTMELGSGMKAGEPMSLRQVVEHCTGVQEILQSKKTLVTGFKTGIKELDVLTGGFQLGETTAFGAPRKAGKTALALQTAILTALEGHRVYVALFEMTQLQLYHRLLSHHLKLPMQDVRRGMLDEHAWSKVQEIPKKGVSSGTDKVLDNTIIDMCQGLTVSQVEARIRMIDARLKQSSSKRIKLVIWDYLQKIQPEYGSNREQEVSAIAAAVEAAGIRLNVAQLALTQLNEEGKARESRAIEFHTDAFVRMAVESPTERTVEVVCSRNGQAGAVQVYFNGETQTFADMAASYRDPGKIVRV